MAVELPEPLQWVLLLLAGTRWPEADEDQLRDMAEHWRRTATGLQDAAHAADATVKRSLDGQTGRAAEALTAHWAQYMVGKGTEDEPGYLPGLYQACAGMGDMLESMANSAETAKIQIIAQLGILAFEIATAEAEAPVTAGASLVQVPVMIATGRAAVQQILKTLLKEMLALAAKQALQMAAINLMAQAIELAEGHRKSIDMKEVGQNALGGAVAGATGHLIGKGVGAAGAKLGLGRAMESTVGKMAVGAGVGVGTDAATQLITTGKVDGGSLLGSGLSGGAGAGLHAGAAAARSHFREPTLPGSHAGIPDPAAHGRQDGPPTFSTERGAGGPSAWSGSGSGSGADSGSGSRSRSGLGGDEAYVGPTGGEGTGAGGSRGIASGDAPRPSGLVPFGSEHPPSARPDSPAADHRPPAEQPSITEHAAGGHAGGDSGGGPVREERPRHPDGGAGEVAGGSGGGPVREHGRVVAPDDAPSGGSPRPEHGRVETPVERPLGRSVEHPVAGGDSGGGPVREERPRHPDGGAGEVAGGSGGGPVREHGRVVAPDDMPSGGSPRPEHGRVETPVEGGHSSAQPAPPPPVPPSHAAPDSGPAAGGGAGGPGGTHLDGTRIAAGPAPGRTPAEERPAGPAPATPTPTGAAGDGAVPPSTAGAGAALPSAGGFTTGHAPAGHAPTGQSPVGGHPGGGSGHQQSASPGGSHGQPSAPANGSALGPVRRRGTNPTGPSRPHTLEQREHRREQEELWRARPGDDPSGVVHVPTRDSIPRMTQRDRLRALGDMTPEMRRHLSRDQAFVDSLRDLSPGDFAQTAAHLMVHVDPRATEPGAARHEAQSQVARMLRDPAVTARLLVSGAEVVVVPRDIRMTSVPGFENLRGQAAGGESGHGRGWDDIRGSGGLRAGVTEENLLGGRTPIGPGGGYQDGYSTTTHEFAHTIHQFGLEAGDRTAITEAFARRRAQGHDVEWVDGTRRRHGLESENYSSTDELEYFAQVSNAYLSTNHGTDPGTGQARHTGPDWVRRNEPDLIDLLERLYGPDPLALNTGGRANPVDAAGALADVGAFFALSDVPGPLRPADRATIDERYAVEGSGTHPGPVPDRVDPVSGHDAAELARRREEMRVIRESVDENGNYVVVGSGTHPGPVPDRVDPVSGHDAAELARRREEMRVIRESVDENGNYVVVGSGTHPGPVPDRVDPVSGHDAAELARRREEMRVIRESIDENGNYVVVGTGTGPEPPQPHPAPPPPAVSEEGSGPAGHPGARSGAPAPTVHHDGITADHPRGPAHPDSVDGTAGLDTAHVPAPDAGSPPRERARFEVAQRLTGLQDVNLVVGGSQALKIHGLLDRPTDDIDLFPGAHGEPMATGRVAELLNGRMASEHMFTLDHGGERIEVEVPPGFLPAKSVETVNGVQVVGLHEAMLGKADAANKPFDSNTPEADLRKIRKGMMDLHKIFGVKGTDWLVTDAPTSKEVGIGLGLGRALSRLNGNDPNGMVLTGEDFRAAGIPPGPGGYEAMPGELRAHGANLLAELYRRHPALDPDQRPAPVPTGPVRPRPPRHAEGSCTCCVIQ
ncbi:hypothetical protein [Kitasatospora sp. NPDC094015]|uniref:WXG100-like domain-containing protein n=1 Tax=Kitasatospora sp. NPDC094015 TaxID=3155205 RepID=UPI00332EE868